MTRLRAPAIPGIFRDSPYTVGPLCGTASGRRRHERAREPECDACRAYTRDAQRRHRRRTSTECVKGLGWPVRSAP